MQPVSLFVVLIFVVKMLRAHHLESYNSFSHLSCGSSILMIYNLSSLGYDVIGQPLLV